MPTKSTGARGGRWTSDERQFVRNAYPALGPVAIARKLNRSRSGVCALIKRMKESGEIATAKSTAAGAGGGLSAPPADAPDGTQDTLGRLRWVRGLLTRHLYDAEPPQAARLASEYRAVVDEIDRLERQGGGGGDDAIERIADALARRA